MKIGYGFAIQESDDPYISTAEDAMNRAAEATILETFWVDFVSYSEICGMLVLRCRFSKEGCMCERSC